MYCKNCGTFFVEKTPRQKYCGKKCQRGIRSAGKYSARYGMLVKDHFYLRRVEKALPKFNEEIKT